MEKDILNFAKQFAWKPELGNEDKLLRAERVVVGGMGGSHLAADSIRGAYPAMPIHVWSDYGLPAHEGLLNKALCIASSYSGNTEETIDFAEQARKRGLPIAVIATGGELLAFAKNNGLPYVEIPDTRIQPRVAIGYSTIALALVLERALGVPHLLKDVAAIAGKIKPAELREAGGSLAQAMAGRIPVIYASEANRAVAYVWKITFNETGKTPAFYNIFPELNHNELAGFGGKNTAGFHAIFLTDSSDNAHIQKRMLITEELYREHGVATSIISLDELVNGEGRQAEASSLKGVVPTAPEPATSLEKAFAAIIVSMWAALATAKANGSDPEPVAIVESLKKRLK